MEVPNEVLVGMSALSLLVDSRPYDWGHRRSWCVAFRRRDSEVKIAATGAGKARDGMAESLCWARRVTLK
jgi:hypothetical protein